MKKAVFNIKKFWFGVARCNISKDFSRFINWKVPRQLCWLQDGLLQGPAVLMLLDAFGGLSQLLGEAELGLGAEELSGLSPAGALVGMSPAHCPALSAPV